MNAVIELIQKNVTLRNGRTVSLLTPGCTTGRIGGLMSARGDYLLVSGGSGFALLSKVLTLAADLQGDEFVQLPLGLVPDDELKKVFPDEHFDGVVLVGENTERIALKDINAAIKARKFHQKRVLRAYSVPEAEYFEETWWKRSRKLTIKPLNDHFIIKADRDAYLNFACYCAGMATFGDDASANLRVHQRFPAPREGEPGLAFYYWYEE